MSKYHGITEETKVGKNGKTVHRLIALETFKNGSVTVEKGTLGGWVRNVENIHDNAWVYDDAELLDNASMWDYSQIRNNASMWDYSQIRNNASMWDYSQIRNNASMYNNSQARNFTIIWNKASLRDNSVMRNSASVAGSVILWQDSELAGDAYLSETVDLSTGAYVTEELQVLSLKTYTSVRLHTTLYPTRDGEYRVKMGCWEGTVDKLEELFKEDEWVETTGQDAEDAREEMLTMVTLMRARIKRIEARK